MRDTLECIGAHAKGLTKWQSLILIIIDKFYGVILRVLNVNIGCLLLELLTYFTLVSSQMLCLFWLNQEYLQIFTG